MSLLRELEKKFSKYHINPVKFRGQNFLIDEEVLDEIIFDSEIKSGDTILEIGPGLGFLTERLIGRAKKVIAVELDTQLFKILRKKFEEIKNLELINEDILAFSPSAEKYKLVANIPYEITSAILQKFLTCVLPPEEMVLLVQREVAERIVDPKKRSLLSISVWLYGEPEVVATVPPAAFYPEPEVTSAILRIKVKNLSADERQNNEKALKIAKIGFINPRKKLINNLSAGLAMPRENLLPVFTELGLGENIRAEELAPDDWLRVERELKNII
jgi:16S rRNA (adenine1518-N6/adenine1519-N6)-dimethyltransferase